MRQTFFGGAGIVLFQAFADSAMHIEQGLGGEKRNLFKYDHFKSLTVTCLPQWRNSKSRNGLRQTALLMTKIDDCRMI